jgi:hypothetical protein
MSSLNVPLIVTGIGFIVSLLFVERTRRALIRSKQDSSESPREVSDIKKRDDIFFSILSEYTKPVADGS